MPAVDRSVSPADSVTKMVLGSNITEIQPFRDKKGMRIHKEQLSNIYDTWIILYRPKEEVMNDGEMIIGYIGKEPNEESAALYTLNSTVTYDTFFLHAIF